MCLRIDRLQTYNIDMCIIELKSIYDLAVKVVTTNRDKLYPLPIDCTLTLILPIALTTVERTIYIINILNNCLITYMEKTILNLFRKHENL